MRLRDKKINLVLTVGELRYLADALCDAQNHCSEAMENAESAVEEGRWELTRNEYVNLKTIVYKAASDASVDLYRRNDHPKTEPEALPRHE